MSSIKYIPVDCLTRGRYQPRRVFKHELLQELADSIQSQGIIEPLIVRALNAHRYEIIAGERRWRAAQLAQLSEVPCIVRDYSDSEAAQVTLIENIQRENLNPIETAQAFHSLIHEFHYTHEDLAKSLGQSRVKITNTLRLLNLDTSVQQMLIDGLLTEGHGKILASLPLKLQLSLAEHASQQTWTVRQLEQAIQQQKKNPPSNAVIDPNIKRLEKRTSDHFGAEVVVENLSNQSGWIKLKYQNYDILTGILEKMGIVGE